MARRPVYNRHTGVLIPPPPPFKVAHLLYTFHGTLPGGTKWTVGLRTEAANPPADQMQVLADYAARSWARGANAASGFRGMNPAGCVFSGVTLRALDVNGVTTQQFESAAVNQPGNATSQLAPDQTAVVVSLHTALAGRHGKGRIFIPVLAAPYDNATGKVSGAVPFQLQAFIQQLIDDLNVQNGLDPGPAPVTHYAICIQGRTLAITGAPVREVLVGDVSDTMRRRRRKLSEVYTSGTLITPPVV